MKTKLMAAVAVVAIMASAGVATAQTADDVAALKAQAAALKKQNQALEQRLNKIEKQQAKEQAVLARQPAPAAAAAPATAGSFVAQASNLPGQLLNGDGPLTWNGITVFGTFDTGLSYASHGAPMSGGFYAGDTYMQKFYNHAMWNMAPSGLSQTTLGIKGEEELMSGVSGVFYASTGINPQSGQLANAPGSQVANNGIPLYNQSMNIDGTRGGQPFNDQLYAGLSSKTFGQLTFGRHKTFSNDLLSTYDPAGAAYNYSPIGYSGTPVAGLGETDLGREDNTMKYRVAFPLLATGVNAHVGGMYKFASGTAGYGSTGVVGNGCGGTTYATALPCRLNDTGYQINAGAQYQALELDGVVSHFNQALTYGALGTGTTNVLGVNQINLGNPGLAGTIADITSFMLAAKYTWNQFKFYAGYANDHYSNPNDPMGVGANTGTGDYAVITVNNTAFPNNKVLQTIWGGVKYAYDPKTEFTLAYYYLDQNSFGTAKAMATQCSGQSTKQNGACFGTTSVVSAYVDYHFTKRFDAYAGLMWSGVTGGMASGYLYTSNWAPSAGIRYTF